MDIDIDELGMSESKLTDFENMCDRLDRLQDPHHYVKPEEVRLLLVAGMQLVAAYRDARKGMRIGVSYANRRAA